MLREQPQDEEMSVLSHHPTSKGRRGHPTRDNPGEATRACRGGARKGDRGSEVQAWQIFGPRSAKPDCRGHSTTHGCFRMVKGPTCPSPHHGPKGPTCPSKTKEVQR